jgi:hypothetical protein
MHGIDIAFFNALSSAILMLLALYLVISALRKTRSERPGAAAARAA